MTRDQSVLEARGVFDGIALSALDGAACQLHVTREELTLALADEDATQAVRRGPRHRLRRRSTTPFEPGLERAVDDAAAAGKIDGIEETILRQVARYAPVGPAISGLQALSDDDSVQGLIEQLGGLTDLQVPGHRPARPADPLRARACRSDRRRLSRAVARFTVRAPWLVVGAWVAIALGCVFLLPDVKSAKTGSLGDLVATDADAITTEERSVELFLFPVLSRTLVVQHRADGLSPRAEARVYERANDIRLGELPGVESIPFALPLTSDAPSDLTTPGGRVDGRPTTAITSLFFPTDIGSEGRTGLAERLVDRYVTGPPTAAPGITGAVPARAEQVRAITDALPLVELATLLLVTLAVGIHYRSPIAPLVNILTVGLVYTVSVHLTGGIGQSIGIAVPEEVEPVMVALLFGIVTDYSIFFISRFRRYLETGLERTAAAERASAELMPTIIAAGLSVAAASAALIAAQLGFFKAFGPGLALSVLVALAVVTTFVPAALAITGRFLFWPSLEGRHRRRRRPIALGASADRSSASWSCPRSRPLADGRSRRRPTARCWRSPPRACSSRTP